MTHDVILAPFFGCSARCCIWSHAGCIDYRSILIGLVLADSHTYDFDHPRKPSLAISLHAIIRAGLRLAAGHRVPGPGAWQRLSHAETCEPRLLCTTLKGAQCRILECGMWMCDGRCRSIWNTVKVMVYMVMNINHVGWLTRFLPSIVKRGKKYPQHHTVPQSSRSKPFV